MRTGQEDGTGQDRLKKSRKILGVDDGKFFFVNLTKNKLIFTVEVQEGGVGFHHRVWHEHGWIGT